MLFIEYHALSSTFKSIKKIFVLLIYLYDKLNKILLFDISSRKELLIF